MQDRRSDPSAVVLDWRKAGSGDAARSREAAAARRRGVIGLAVGLTVAALIFFWKPVLAVVVASISLVLGLIALAAPLTLYKKVMRALDAFAHGVGTVVTWVLMTVLYYLLFLPVGVLLRSRRRLAITRSFDPALTTYWKATDGRERTPESYRKQF
jgi:dolichol kinase